MSDQMSDSESDRARPDTGTDSPGARDNWIVLKPMTAPLPTLRQATPRRWRRRTTAILVAAILLVNIGAAGAVWVRNSGVAMNQAMADLAPHLRAIRTWASSPDPLNAAAVAHVLPEMTAAQTDLKTVQGLIPFGGLIGGQRQLDQAINAENQQLTAIEDLIQAAPFIRPGLRYLLATTLGAPLPAGTEAQALTIESISRAQGYLHKAEVAENTADAEERAVTSGSGSLTFATGNAEVDAFLNDSTANFTTISQSVHLSAALVDLLPSMLGITKTQGHLLLLVMDTDQARGSGGSIGAYGVLSFQAGEVQGQLQMYDASDITCSSACVLHGMPSRYDRAWFSATHEPNDLRNSSLDPDFEWAAYQAWVLAAQQTGIYNFAGVVAVTPNLLEHVLTFTGPVDAGTDIGVVNAKNILAKAQYWHTYDEQLKSQPSHAPVVQFDAEVMRALSRSLSHLTEAQLSHLGTLLLQDLTSGDLRLFSTSSRVENALVGLGRAGGIAFASPGDDGYYVTNADLGDNYDSPYVAESISDTISLSASGQARHHLSVTYTYQPPHTATTTDPYANLMTVVIPASAINLRLQSQDTTKQCTPLNIQIPGGANYTCALTLYPGQPTTVTLTWTTPDSISHDHYTLLVQHQPGSAPAMHVTITPPAGTSIVAAPAGAQMASGDIQWSTNTFATDTTLQLGIQS